MNELLDAIKVVGFPVIVCLWFMVRQDKRLDKMNDLLQLLLNRLDVEAPAPEEKD